MVELTDRELSLCIKGLGALGMIWNKQAREETRQEREALQDKLRAAMLKAENADTVK